MFIWKDICSDSMELIVEKFPENENSSIRESYELIEGRNGYLTVSENCYDGTTKNIECHYEGNDIDGLTKWLQGSGKLILSNIDDRYYKARIKNKISFREILRNRLSKILISFECQPFGYLKSGEFNVKGRNKFTMYNQGNIYSEPLITIRTTGNAILKVNDNILKIDDIAEYITIDSELKMAYKGSLNKNNNIMGEYPILEEGKNVIEVIGDNSADIDIIPRWRCLN